MKKLIISVAILLASTNESKAQSGSIPGFLDDSAPGRDLGGTISGSSGTGSSLPGYSGSSTAGTPGTLTPTLPDKIQKQEETVPPLDVPQAKPSLLQTQPDNPVMPTGIETGRKVDDGNGSSVIP